MVEIIFTQINYFAIAIEQKHSKSNTSEHFFLFTSAKLQIIFYICIQKMY